MQKALIATALGSFGLGALVTWAVMADMHEQQIKAEREGWGVVMKDKTEHIWALQERSEYLKAQNLQLIAKNRGVEVPEVDPNQTTLEEETPEEEAEVVVEIEDDENPIPEGETEEETRTNLQRLIDRYSADPDAQEAFNQFVAEDRTTTNEHPYVISRDDYAFGEFGETFDKITLSYYPREGVLLDDSIDEPIEDIHGTVNARNLRFGQNSEDPDVVFVRNPRLQTDFEVVRKDDPIPLHVKYGMGKEEFYANKAAGTLKLRREDE